MKRTLLISLVVFGVLVLALGGWTVRGARWAGGSPARFRPRFA
jgi:hypothetical protein